LPITIIQPSAQAREEISRRPVWRSLVSGFQLLCPNCRNSRLVKPYLRVADHCARCGQIYSHHRADNAPAYFTILVAGHLVLLPMLICLRLWPAPLWPHFVIWPLAVIGLTLLLLPRVKGALVALQWALRMHGFNAMDESLSAE
jgi:uncharacterized protein (DUF983 family)